MKGIIMSIRVSNSYSNNVSFNGITKLGNVFVDGVLSCDEKIVEKNLRKFKKILLTQADTLENSKHLAALRNGFSEIDKDYFPPRVPIKGSSKYFLSRMKSHNDYYFLSANDAEVFAESGYSIGKTSKFQSPFKNEAARLYYGILKNILVTKYDNLSQKPFFNLFLKTNNLKKIDNIELEKVYFYPSGKTFFINPPTTPPIKPPKQKVYIQQEFKF